MLAAAACHCLKRDLSDKCRSKEKLNFSNIENRMQSFLIAVEKKRNKGKIDTKAGKTPQKMENNRGLEK